MISLTCITSIDYLPEVYSPSFYNSKAISYAPTDAPRRLGLSIASLLSLFYKPDSPLTFLLCFLHPPLSTFNSQSSSPNNSFPFTHLILFLDKYRTRMVIWYLIVSYHARRSPLLPPRSLRVRHLAPFSFLFFNFRLSTLNFGLSSSRNSFPHNSLSDPQVLNPVLSILYKKRGGGVGDERSLRVPTSSGGNLLFLPFCASLFCYVVTSNSERHNHVPNQHFS